MVFPTVSSEATHFLAHERRVYGLGVDTISPEIGYPSIPHRILFSRNIYIVENLANLHLVPAMGASAVVLPMNIARSTGAPARVIAFLP